MFREQFENAGSVSMELTLRADYGERVCDYRLSCRSAGGETAVTVLEPESVKGAVVRILSDGSVSLSAGGAEVYTGGVLEDGLSPVDAVPAMLKAWKSGLVTGTSAEKFGGEACEAAVFRLSDQSSLRTWFSLRTSLPVHAEIYRSGAAVILCDFNNVGVE